MIKQLLNSVIAKYRDLSVSRILACVQTSPLPQGKSGEEMSVNRRR